MPLGCCLGGVTENRRRRHDDTDTVRHEWRFHGITIGGDIPHQVRYAIGQRVPQVSTGIAEGHAGEGSTPHQLIACLVIIGTGNAALEVGTGNLERLLCGQVTPRIGSLDQRSLARVRLLFPNACRLSRYNTRARGTAGRNR